MNIDLVTVPYLCVGVNVFVDCLQFSALFYAFVISLSSLSVTQ